MQKYNTNSIQKFSGLSTDTKPTDCASGSIFTEIDTAKRYIFEASTAQWTAIPSTGGGVGTDDYDDLTSKPQINGVTLSGNKSLADIGAASEESLSAESASREHSDEMIEKEITALTQRVTELEERTKELKVYGWHINPDESDPDAAVTYLLDAVGKTPAKMGSTSFDYGSWEDAFFMPKPCMLKSDGTVAYYLNPNNYAQKIDGTTSDIANSSFDGNAMMEWPKIYYKFAAGSADGEEYFYVSNIKVDDSYHCWCNTDSKNNEIDHFYTAIYNGTGTTKLRSLSGVALTSANGNGGTTATQEVTRATANNTKSDAEWYIDVFADRLLINSLLVLIGKSLNTQGVFGNGLSTGGQSTKEAYVTGALNTKGLFWGDCSGQTSAAKVFGMENWYGCVWRRTAGCVSVDNALKTKLTYGTADGSTTNGYNETGSGYISNGSIPTTNGYASKIKYNQYGYMISEARGSASTYYCDYFYQNTETRYLLAGGRSDSGLYAGCFYFSLNNTASSTHWYVGAALSCKPLA